MANITMVNNSGDEARKIFDIIHGFADRMFKILGEINDTEQFTMEQKQDIALRLPEIMAYRQKHNISALRMTFDMSHLRTLCHKIVNSVPTENRDLAIEFCKETLDYDPTDNTIRVLPIMPT